MTDNIGESVLLSYFKYEKKCRICCQNWTNSKAYEEKSNVIKIYDKLYNENTTVKENFTSKNGQKRTLENILNETEIDVIGVNGKELYIADVAFHNNGLGYGDNEDRIFKKLFRFCLTCLQYFSDYESFEIMFASPIVDDDDKKTESFENYSELDVLERCGVAYANISREIMPTEERGSIGNVKPSGWQTIKYDNIDGKYLYNRCHLIGYQLAGENANPKNLITCTRQMNTIGMLDFENQVSNYVKKTNNHVLYRVTPIFKDNELVARGVQIEALSVEDNGKGIKFNVFVYNVQNGIEIDYNTGNSKLIENKEN